MLRLIGLSLFIIFYSICPRARAVKLLAPTWFGMDSIAPHIYVDRSMPVEQRKEALNRVEEARSKLLDHYGEVTTDPTLLFFSSESAYRSFGGTTETGLTFGSYASLFSPRGMSAPIVAHEWSHAELFSRLGFWNWRRVPQWFDEGLAVVISEETRHSELVYQEALEAGASPPALSELMTLRQWSQAVKKYRDPELNPDNRAIVYATAGHEVREWFKHAGISGLKKFLNEIRSGTDFAATYSKAAESD
jgi:hypothetical protein